MKNIHQPGAFDVFLSHNSQDKPIVRELGEALKDRGLEVWLDEWELVPGHPWQTALEAIIHETRSAAVLVGASGFGPWHEAEMRALLSKLVTKGLPVIPVLLPGAEKEIELPLFLPSVTWVDLRDGLTDDGLDRLEWGITGKKPTRRRTQPATPEPDLSKWLARVETTHSRLTPTFQRKRKTALSHIYVELRIAERERMERWREACRAATKVTGGPGGDRMTLEEILGLDVDGDLVTGRWLLYGDPGSGKTTLLRHLAATLAKRGQDGEATWVPVVESLPKLARERAAYFPDLLAEHFRRILGGDVGAHAERLDALAESGRLLLLFDGLDEVPKEHRDEVEELLVGAAERWEDAVIVVTSRPIGGRSPGEDFRHLELLPFADKDRREFLAKWLTEDAAPDWTRADAALAHLHRDPMVRELAGNPLYLTLLATLFEEGVDIPERRSRLYDKIFEFLLAGKHWPDREAIKYQDKVHGALRYLAEEMTRDDVDVEPFSALESRLADLAPARAELASCLRWADDPGLFLNEVAEKTSILGAHDGDEADWRYWHRTFREALAAERLEALREKEGEEALLAHARERTEEDAGRWAEPYALLVGRIDEPGELVRELAKANRALGLRALGTAQGVGEEVLAEVLELADDWKERIKVYRRVPSLLGAKEGEALAARDAEAALRLIDRLRQRKSNDGNDLFFLEQAAVEIAQSCPEVRLKIEELRARFFDHLPSPPRELFETIVTPKDREVELWREIPAGTFWMGGPDSEPDFDEEKAPLGAYDDERPQHEVEISQPLRMMATQVTNAQYRAFDPSRGSEDPGQASHPIAEVSWYEAAAFCRWLARGGYDGARLPTEAEWEYACRAGTTSRFWNGDTKENVAEVGWYGGNSGIRTYRVGEKAANPWGLYDVHGNVWEWCGDTWALDAYKSRAEKQPVVDPCLPPSDPWDTQELRVLRGGSYWLGAGHLRAACRFGFGSGHRGDGFGFRVLLCGSPEP